MWRGLGVLLLVVFAAAPSAMCRDSSEVAIPDYCRVYVAPTDGFETYLMAALHTKNVPVLIVADKDKADFEIRGTARQKGDSVQSATTVTNSKSGIVAFAYSYDESYAMHGKQSAAEAFAKHLKDKMAKH